MRICRVPTGNSRKTQMPNRLSSKPEELKMKSLSFASNSQVIDLKRKRNSLPKFHSNLVNITRTETETSMMQ